MNIGEKLTILRKERGLTQKEVADALEFSRSIYSQYERNEREPSVHRLVLLSRFYRTSLDYLCGNSEREFVDISDLNNEEQAKIFAIIRNSEFF